MKIHIPENVIRWLGPAIIIAIGGFIIIGNPLSQKFFCEQTQNCFATWVAALSGWVAVAVGAPTVFLLWRQVAVAQMQAHDSFSIQLRRSLAAAHQARAAADELASYAGSFDTPAIAYGTAGGWSLFKTVMLEVEKMLNSEIFQIVEREIAFPKEVNSIFLREFMTTFKREQQDYLTLELIADDTARKNIHIEWGALTRQSVIYAEEIERIALDFIKECEAMLRKYQ